MTGRREQLPPPEPRFFQFQSPLDMALIAALNGFPAPDITRSFVHLDLGCGQGMTTLVLAAAFPNATFIGVDRDPEAIGLAERRRATAEIGNCRFVTADFSDLAAGRPALPEADFLTMQGILSWVPEPVLDDLCFIAGRLVRPGGLMLASYNAMPQKIVLEPMRRLLAAFSDGDASTGMSIEARSARALEKVRAMAEAGGGFLNEYASVRAEMDRLGGAALDRLHEFWSDSWRNFYPHEAAALFSGAGFGYAGEAVVERNFPALSLSPGQRRLVLAEADRSLRETMKSHFIGNGFRVDLFIRSSAIPVEWDDWAALLAGHHFTLAKAPEEVPEACTFGGRTVPIAKEVREDVRALWGGRSAPFSAFLDRHGERPAADRLSPARLAGILVALLAKGVLTPMTASATMSTEGLGPDDGMRARLTPTHPLTVRLLEEAVYARRDRAYFVSPLRGGAIGVSGQAALQVARAIGLDEADAPPEAPEGSPVLAHLIRMGAITGRRSD